MTAIITCTFPSHPDPGFWTKTLDGMEKYTFWLTSKPPYLHPHKVLNMSKF